jgi:hypothetical protein
MNQEVFLLSGLLEHLLLPVDWWAYALEASTFDQLFFSSNKASKWDLGRVWFLGLKFNRCHVGCYMRLTMGCSDNNKKNKLHISWVIRETNLLNLINPSAAHFTVAISADHGLIRLKKSSRKLASLYIFSFVNSLYLVFHACVQYSMW